MPRTSSLIVVKVGSNVLTDESGHLRTEVMGRIVEQIAELKHRGFAVMLVTSGAMAAGRGLLGMKASGKDGVTARQLLAAVGQAHLLELYRQICERHGMLCAQVLLTKADVRSREHFVNMQRCLTALLQDNVLPIINENDVVSVQELMFTDNDELAAMLASMLSAERVFILTSVDGVFAGKPGDPGVQVIHEVSPGSQEWKSHIHAFTSQFGRGGMHTKCAMAARLAGMGIETFIVNGLHENVIVDALDGKRTGTRFAPSKRVSGKKRWLATAGGLEKGRVIINACAVEVLRSAVPTSLLPVGVVRVEGEFSAGDLVAICDEAGKEIGLGEAAYGMAQARASLGKKRVRPLIHYDYLHLF